MILITEFMDEAAVASLSERHDVVYAPDLAERQGDIAPLLSPCRALIVRNRTRVTAELLAAAPALSCVGRLGVGLDNIDLPAAKARDIAVFPATGANDVAVAEYVIGTAMVLLRGAYGRTGEVVAGAWPRSAATGREIAGKVLGLVGYGGTARQTGRLAAAVGMEVIAHDPLLDPGDADVPLRNLPALLGEADVVSLHVPLSEATRGMIGATELAGMKRASILVNAARGGVVDEAALVAALRAGAIAGAALDVFSDEPLTSTGGAPFADVPNLILTPHIAGVTAESNVRVSRLIARKVSAHLGCSGGHAS